MRYLIITEDDQLYLTDTLTADMKIACDEGIWQVIDMKTKLQYSENKWVAISTFNIKNH